MSGPELLSTAAALGYGQDACVRPAVDIDATPKVVSMSSTAPSALAVRADAIEHASPMDIVADIVASSGGPASRLAATMLRDLPAFSAGVKEGTSKGLEKGVRELLRGYLEVAYAIFDFLEEAGTVGLKSAIDTLLSPAMPAITELATLVASAVLGSERSLRLATELAETAKRLLAVDPESAQLLLHLASIAAVSGAVHDYLKSLRDSAAVVEALRMFQAFISDAIQDRLESLARIESPGELGEMLGELQGRVAVEITFLLLGF
jgi:hypothetical protein